ncbi:MAG: FAD-dependent monooxygenase, partial [Stellaceae bacterium]
YERWTMDTSVLIVGGGLVGLALGIERARLGVDAISVDARRQHDVALIERVRGAASAQSSG